MKFQRWSYFSTLMSILILPALFLVSSCKHEGTPADQLPQICFTEQVLPIFQNSCATTGCHSAGKGERGSLADYSGIMNMITPGNAAKSKAYQAMTSSIQLMPPNNALPIAKRTIIRLWIEQGAKETTCTTSAAVPDVVVPAIKSGTTLACYNRDIQPMLLSSCAVSGCHNATSRKEGIDLSSYAKTIAAISAGNPSGSKLYKAITASTTSESFMPPKPYSPLSKAAIDTIYNWIKRGGLNEECASVCDTTGTIGYITHIKSITDIACVSCHGANSPSGGITLLTAANLQTVAKTGKLLGAVKRKTGFVAMPPAYSLTTCEIRQIELWINQGYK